MRPTIVLVAALACGCHDLDHLRSFVRPPAAGADGAAADGMAPPPAVPPSCQALSRTCGSRGESCCATEPVPAQRSFVRGHDASGQPVQNGRQVLGWQPQSALDVSVDGFLLDRFEVTVGRFRSFLMAYDGLVNIVPRGGNGSHPRIPGSGWNASWTNRNRDEPGVYYAPSKEALRGLIGRCNAASPTDKILDWLDRPGPNDNKPMTCVSWYEAYLFCIWDGGRLPTEAEWNVAAAGGERYAPYPWALKTPTLEVTAEHANIGPITSFALKDVGSHEKGESLWHHHDLAGNAYELVRDRNDKLDSYIAERSNPLSLQGSNLVVRGGSYQFDAVNARTAYRFSIGDSGSERYQDLGWRCARDP